MSNVENLVAGSKTIRLLPNQTAILELYAGGGAGGGSVYTGGAPSPKGGDGGNSTLSINGVVLAYAGGGIGGTGGWWGNGSHMSEGAGGAEGVNGFDLTKAPAGLVISVLSNVNGVKGWVNRWSPQSTVPGPTVNGVAAKNTGGAGAWGIGDESRAGGGSGGSGGYIKVSIVNTTKLPVDLMLSIGKGGTATTWGNLSSPGGDGYGTISLSELVLQTFYKTLTASLKVAGNVVDSVSQLFSYLEVAEPTGITIDPEYAGNHINLWDYYKWKFGAEPAAGEEITFIIPEDKMYIAPMGYISALRSPDGAAVSSYYNKWAYSNEVTHAGAPAVSLKGWKKSLNNSITVDIRGKAIGTPSVKMERVFSPFNKKTGKPLTYMEFKRLNLVSDPYAYWKGIIKLCALMNSAANPSITNPKKNPAFYSDVDCTVIVRKGAYVVGGGGDKDVKVYNRSTITANNEGLEDTYDDVNCYAGDAILVGGTATVKVDNYGYVSGGGGGGASIGSILDGLVYPSSAYAEGGGGAPFGNSLVSKKFPLYIDLDILKTLPLGPSTLTDIFMEWDTDTGTWAESNNTVVLSKDAVARIIDWARVGIDPNNDNFYDISEFTNPENLPRLLSPQPGSESASNGIASNAMTVASGSGGAPGVNGQTGRYIQGSPNWNPGPPNTAGFKGAPVEIESSGTPIVNNYPGSVYNT